MIYTRSGILYVLKTVTIVVIPLYYLDFLQIPQFHKTNGKITNKLVATKNDQFLQNEQAVSSSQIASHQELQSSYASSSAKLNDKAPNSDQENIFEPSSGEVTNWLKKMEIKYAETNDHIKKVCQKYDLSDRTKARYKQFMVDTTHHLAFCRNAKVGTTTWMHHFNDLLPVDERPWGDGTGKLKDMIRVRINRKFKANQLGKFRNPGEEFPKLFEQNNYTVFSFVRHPFERLVSAYNDKINTEKVPFTRFVDKVIKRFAEQTEDRHWKTFVSRCQYCYVPYNVIGRMETFQEDVQYIILKNKLEKLLPLDKALNFQSINSSKRDVNDTTQLTREKFYQLSNEQIQNLYKIYQLDFELFDYDIDIFLQPQDKEVVETKQK